MITSPVIRAEAQSDALGAAGMQVNRRKQQSVVRKVQTATKLSKQETRREVAIAVQREVEQRVSEARAVTRKEVEASHEAETAQWREKEAKLTEVAEKLHEKVTTDGSELDLLRGKQDEAIAAVESVDDAIEAARREARAEYDRRSAEQSRESAFLRGEVGLLRAQLGVFEAEVRQVEHESKLNEMMSVEAMDSAATAARELVPLRSEVVEQRQEAVAVARAVEEMKSAKEEDSSSFLLAKACAARIMRMRHQRALSAAEAAHRAELDALEARRAAEEDSRLERERRVGESVADEWRQNLARQRLAEDEAREAMRERLRVNMEEEKRIAADELRRQAELALHRERMSAAARLVQTHRRLRDASRADQESLARQHEQSTSELLQQYANDAQARRNHRVTTARPPRDRLSTPGVLPWRRRLRPHPARRAGPGEPPAAEPRRAGAAEPAPAQPSDHVWASWKAGEWIRRFWCPNNVY